MTPTFRRGLGLAFVALTAGACTERRSDAVPSRGAASLAPDAPPAARVAAAGGVVTSTGENGAPEQLWEAGDGRAPEGLGAEAAARWHLARYTRAAGRSPLLAEQAELLRVRTTPAGAVVARFRQRAGGIEVYRSEIKVLMRKDHSLVAITGTLNALDGDRTGPRAFIRPPEDALLAALSDLFRTPLDRRDILSAAPRAGGTPGVVAELSLAPRVAASGGPDLAAPAAVKRVYFPGPRGLIPAYFLEVVSARAPAVDSDAYRYVVSARDAAILEKRNLVEDDAYGYRVWAGPDLRPLDGPHEEWSPRPAGAPRNARPAPIPPSLVTVEGLNVNPLGLPDPWLAAGAAETTGNNAEAYADHYPPDGFSEGDVRATVTAPGLFDRAYDTALEPLANADQTMAAATHAFYVVNWLHDAWYGAGFDEAAGNAQADNFGRGGAGGDAMRVEVQDAFFAGRRNNANMFTPSDGARPRMQIYVWSGIDLGRGLELSPGGTFATGVAAFGPQVYDVTAPLVLANDGAGTTTDACTALPPANGAIVLVDRGACTFVIKAANVQAAGGAGMIVANNVAGTTPLGLGGANPAIVIPSAGITRDSGTAIKALLAQGPVTAHLFHSVGVEHEGALDSTVIAHEWGHYLHHRLADCGFPQCRAMSEGWGDFLSLHTISREGDDLGGIYPLAVYSVAADPLGGYTGIRRAPYSVDPAVNGLSFRHIADGEPLPPEVLVFGPNSEVHNAGEIWTSMLWEGYVALQRARPPELSFEDVRRRMAAYVVAGLELVPSQATYTEQRDAILSAARAADEASPDMLLLAQAFARRGAGTCAISPPRDSGSLVGVVESFELGPRIELGEVRIDDHGRTCDRDEIIDAAEFGEVAVNVANGGPIDAVDTIVTLSSPTPGVVFPAGNTQRINKIKPFASHTARIKIAVDRALAGRRLMRLDVSVANAAACETNVTRSVNQWINADDARGVSASDDVESSFPAWTPAGEGGAGVWSRVEIAAGDRAWLGADSGAPSDTQLVSPALVVSPAAPLVIAFDHRYSFEADATAFYDGGAIEISRDGTTWEDISAYADPHYGGVLFTESENPLGGRAALVGRNPAYPARERLTLDLGTAFAGQTVRMRFRIGTDAAVSDYGWELDGFTVSGITNLPFSALVDDATTCR